MKSTAPQVRALLRRFPDGLSTAQVTEMAGITGQSTLKTLHRMEDVYIDRWEGPTRGQYVAVWCLVDVPEDCPHPRRAAEQRIETTWRTA